MREVGSFGPSWAPTAQVVLHGRIVRETREFKGSATLAGVGAEIEDTFTGYRLAAGWNPRRFLELTIAADKGERSSNFAPRDYDYTAVMANARVRF